MKVCGYVFEGYVRCEGSSRELLTLFEGSVVKDVMGMLVKDVIGRFAPSRWVASLLVVVSWLLTLYLVAHVPCARCRPRGCKRLLRHVSAPVTGDVV